MISINSLTIQYGNQIVLSDFSLHVPRGEKLCIYGPSGCGKSSLLEIIAGIKPIAKGIILFDGLVLDKNSIDVVRSEIGYLPQLFDIPLTDFNELSTLLHLSVNEINNALEIGANLLLTKSVFEAKFSDLSGGEKQRLLLSAVLSQNKKVFLLDEPGSALDPKSSELLFRFLQQIPATIISVSHNDWWIDHATQKLHL